MIEFREKNYFLSQLTGTLFYTSFVTLGTLLILETAKRGFVSYHFNLVWLCLAMIVFGGLYAIFRASSGSANIFSYTMYVFSLLMIFMVFAGQINIDIINKYFFPALLVIIFGLALWIIRPTKK